MCVRVCEHVCVRVWQVVKMLVVVLAVFVVTWLPSMLMQIIRYHHKAKPPGEVRGWAGRGWAG